MTRPSCPARWNSAQQLLRRPRAPLLAGFVAFHVLTVLVLSLPSSGRLGARGVWESRENQQQFARWSRYASRLGLARDGAELEELAWRLTQGYLRARRAFAAPFEAYAALAGVRQGWRMFSNPQTHPGYVHLELRRGAELEPLYVSRSSAHTWRREQLDHHRVRKLFGRIARSTEPALWDQLGSWAARQAAADFPDAAELRIWQERRATPEPGSPAAAAAGVVEAVWVDAASGGMLTLGSGNWLVRLLGGPTPQAVWGLFGVALGAAVLSLLGLGGRWPLLVTLQAYFGVTSLNPTASGGYDNLICIALWLLFLSSCTATFSLDARLAQGRWWSERRVR